MVVFEEIFLKHFWLIQWYLLKKEKIYFLRVHKSCYDTCWFSDYIANGRLEKIEVRFEVSPFHGFYYDAAFDNVEIFFRGYLNNGILKNIRKLYGSVKSDLAFKKVLTQHLGRFYYHNFILNVISKKYPDKRIVFIPSNGIEHYRSDGCDLYEYNKFYRQAKERGAWYCEVVGVKFSSWAAIISYFNAVRRKFASLGKVFALPMWLFYKCIKNIRKNFKDKQVYDYLITVISLRRQFANKIQKVDFLIDGKSIKKDQVVFAARERIANDEKKYFIKNSLNFIEDTSGFISLKTIRGVFKSYFMLLLLSFKEDDLVVKTGLKGVYFYAVWSSLLEHIIIKNFITYCDYEIKAVFRNILLEQGDCSTYLYMDSSNMGCFVSKNNSPVEYRHHYFGFLHYDWFISWNNKVFDFFQKSFCQFKQHADLGCFWSEHVRLIQEGKLISHIKDRFYAAGYKDGMKIVSVFDSTFHDDSETTYDDGIKFLKDIYTLLDEVSDIFLILKEKNLRYTHETMTGKHKEINVLYKKFDGHPRCYCTSTQGNSSEIIAYSDLTISFPFTSTSYEAVSARKKAIWHDASNKHRDTFYDNIPGLVTHNYEEFITRVNELLFETSEDEYSNYLDAHVKGKVEAHLDGKAITRFRNILNNAPMIPETDAQDHVLIEGTQ